MDLIPSRQYDSDPASAAVRAAGENAVVDMAVAERILDTVAAIPAGRVASYGDIAARVGSRAPRLVGRVLAELSDDTTPWHRVLRADGRSAHHLAHLQGELLRAEGVLMVDGRVDMGRYRWRD